MHYDESGRLTASIRFAVNDSVFVSTYNDKNEITGTFFYIPKDKLFLYQQHFDSSLYQTDSIAIACNEALPDLPDLTDYCPYGRCEITNAAGQKITYQLRYGIIKDAIHYTGNQTCSVGSYFPGDYPPVFHFDILNKKKSTDFTRIFCSFEVYEVFQDRYYLTVQK